MLRLTAPHFLFALLLLLPIRGGTQDAPPLGACYLGNGKMLEATASRQLSLNAHVEKFLYQPGGLEIACQGSQKNGDDVVHFIRLVGVKHGATTTLISTTSEAGEDAGSNSEKETPYKLAGCSGDGSYLLLSQEHGVAVTDGADSGGGLRTDCVCVDVGVIPAHLTTLPLPFPESVAQGTVFYGAQYWWSPDRTRIAFAMPGSFRQNGVSVERQQYKCIYDPKTGSLQALSLDDQQFVRGWLDNGHLLVDDQPSIFENLSNSKAAYSSYTIATGVVDSLPRPNKPLSLPDNLNQSVVSDISPKAPYLKLEDEPRLLLDKQNTGAVVAHVLWMRRTQGPKIMSSASVGLTPGEADPQAVWSPNGTQIAFIAHGDLFVTDLALRDATAQEKYKAGEALTCEEERDAAASNLKQVGLAIFQYVQDYDEKYPPSDWWQEKIKPYLGADTFLSVGSHPVVYLPPANLALAAMEDPAGTVIATTDLPCASLALMGDGHVRLFANKAAEQKYVDDNQRFLDSQHLKNNPH